MAHLIKKRSPTPEHIWLGVSAEDQVFADNRIPPLLAIGGDSLKWVSAEPLLGPMNLKANTSTNPMAFINELYGCPLQISRITLWNGLCRAENREMGGDRLTQTGSGACRDQCCRRTRPT